MVIMDFIFLKFDEFGKKIPWKIIGQNHIFYVEIW
jgi:hypothetical protein